MDKIEEANFDSIDIANFWMKVKKISSDSPFNIAKGNCWEWQGTLFSSGYGHFVCHQKSYRAHRVSYYLLNGKISKDKLICHECDNIKCVNPKHLFEGTPKDNSLDRDKKGRYKPPGRHKKCSSRYHGVFYYKEKKENKWRAKIWNKYKCISIGYFKTEKEAAHAYDKKIKDLNIDKPTNFI